MTKTLIIPDLHHRWKQAEKIIASVAHDNVIFLGDYYDDFFDTAQMVQETTEWLEASVAKPNRIHCWGNHDIQYAYPYRAFQCAGYQQWKYFIVHDNINPKVWERLVWYTFLDNTWLLSHGGLHKFNVPANIAAKHGDRKSFIESLDNYLQDEIRKGFRMGADGAKSWIFNAGRARWGSQRVGGIIWCDFEREFYPVQGINQIVGHTPQMQAPRWCILEKDPLNSDGRVIYRPYDLYNLSLAKLNDTNLSHNIDLDVHMNTTWAVWDGEKITLGNYNDLCK